MSDTLKPCPFCGSDAFYRTMGEAMNKAARDGVDIGFPNGFRAGIEAAAWEIMALAVRDDSQHLGSMLSDLAKRVMALPTPSTLPQEGGEQ